MPEFMPVFVLSRAVLHQLTSCNSDGTCHDFCKYMNFPCRCCFLQLRHWTTDSECSRAQKNKQPRPFNPDQNHHTMPLISNGCIRAAIPDFDRLTRWIGTLLLEHTVEPSLTLAAHSSSTTTLHPQRQSTAYLP